MFKVFKQLLGREEPAGLSKAEVDLIGLLRLSPQEPLNGKDLRLAQSMSSKGLLRSAGGRKYVLTEKATVAYRSATMGR